MIFWLLDGNKILLDEDPKIEKKAKNKKKKQKFLKYTSYMVEKQSIPGE
jgi:hypothetical protein